MRVELGHAELAGIVDVGEQDLRDRAAARRLVELELAACARATKRSTSGLEVLLQHVVAEVHDEVVVAEEVARDQHAVSEAERLRPGG